MTVASAGRISPFAREREDGVISPSILPYMAPIEKTMMIPPGLREKMIVTLQKCNNLNKLKVVDLTKEMEILKKDGQRKELICECLTVLIACTFAISVILLCALAHNFYVGKII